MSGRQDQETQVGQSDVYQDDLAPGSALETSTASLRDDLNALRSIVRRIVHGVGAGNWFDDPASIFGGDASLKALFFGGGGGLGRDGYKYIAPGQVWEIPDNTQAVLEGLVVNDGTVILDGFMHILAEPKPPRLLPLVGEDADIPNNCIVPVDPTHGPFTLRLRPRGVPGEPVIIVSQSDDPIPPAITVNAQGPKIGGQYTRDIDTPREVLILIRRLGHGWEAY